MLTEEVTPLEASGDAHEELSAASTIGWQPAKYEYNMGALGSLLVKHSHAFSLMTIVCLWARCPFSHQRLW